jgi:ribonucleotide reductase beta subunit family protein with ferritin-like domain
MIILSQAKRMIIIFDNIVGIVIRKNTDENIYQVQCKSENEKNKRILGKYKTEERAKEVLQDIITCYTGDGIVEYNGFICFEIPEE